MSDLASLKIGQIITDPQEKDAIHMAIAPVVAREKLCPGDRVGPYDDEEYGEHNNPIGIVDPFLNKNVKKGEKFWLFLFPGSITSLRHDWTHPSFNPTAVIKLKPYDPPTKSVVSRDEQWIRDYADGENIGYDELMVAADNYQQTGEYFSDGGRFEGMWIPDEFWIHWETVTGKVAKDKGSFFSCSC